MIKVIINVISKSLSNFLFAQAVQIDHEVTKEYCISFVAYITYNRMLLIKVSSKQNPMVTFPRLCEKF